MNKKLLGVLGVAALLLAGNFAWQEVKEVDAEENAVVSEMTTLVTKYYNNGVYTKKTQIDASNECKVDLATYFHGSVQLDRTTYYNGNALLMGDYAGGFDTINSGYGTDENGNMTHFKWNEETHEANIDYTVTKGNHSNWRDPEVDGMEGFYLTLTEITEENYFDSWTSNTYSVTSKDDTYLADFLAFTAPCLEGTFLSSNYFTVTESAPVILKVEEKEGYLSLQIILSETNSGTVNNTSRILSEARVYAGNTLFAEETAYYAVINNTTSHLMTINEENETEYMVTGVSMVANDSFHVENQFGWEYNAVKNTNLESPFTAPYEGTYDFYYSTELLNTWIVVPADPNAGVITIYFDMSWDGVTEVWLNGTAMTKGTYDYGSWMAEIQADTITSLELNFKQGSSWWHIDEDNNGSSKSWNTSSNRTVSMSAGNSYKISDVNWAYQWDNQENKWYTCTIAKI